MTRIVTGKPTMATPIMTAEMKYITVNPTWNVPPSIVARRIHAGAGRRTRPCLRGWGCESAYNPDGSIHISQPPGDHNALGRLRFNFPNKFLVYQHDTPDKYLFAYATARVQPRLHARAGSGEIRRGAAVARAARRRLHEERIDKMFGPNEINIQFPTFMPVHLTYQTAFVDEDGNLQFREDIYGRDAS